MTHSEWNVSMLTEIDEVIEKIAIRLPYKSVLGEGKAFARGKGN